MITTTGSSSVVCAGDFVVLRDISGDGAIVKVIKGRMARVGKIRLPGEQLVGRRFGTAYLKTSATAPLLPVARLEQSIAQAQELNNMSEEVDKDNRNLRFNSDAQQLKASDVVAMKQKGVSGAEVVDALCSNSATFAVSD